MSTVSLVEIKLVSSMLVYSLRGCGLRIHSIRITGIIHLYYTTSVSYTHLPGSEEGGSGISVYTAWTVMLSWTLVKSRSQAVVKPSLDGSAGAFEVDVYKRQHWTVTAPFQFCLSCIRARFAGRMPSLLSGFFLSMGGIVQDDAAMSFKKRRSVLKGGGIL